MKYDTTADFAIVELESPFENSFSVEISPEKPKPGDISFAVGNPKDVAWGGVGWAVIFGIAQDTSLNFYAEENFDLFDIQIMGGYSGGGVFNEKGQLQGIISFTTGEKAETSFRPSNRINEGEIFSEDFEILDGPWKSLNNTQVGAVNLDFIKYFLNLHQVNNIINILNIDLPRNKIDNEFNSLSDEQELKLKAVAGPLRKSVISYSIDGGLPNGSGVIISDKIIATNSHVVEGKEYFKITLFDGTEISGSVLDHHPETDLSLILLDESIPSHIDPVPIAESRPVLHDLGFLIGHPGDLWSTKGGWQVSGAVSGYGRAEIDDRGDILMSGGGSSGMSGGPLFNEEES